MKKLISILIIICANSVFASAPDIIALVNDTPITKYDFEARKKMVIMLNSIDVSDHAKEAALNNGVLNSLIEEEIISQYAIQNNIKVTKEQIDVSIDDIEKRNHMPKNGIIALFKEKEIDIQSFRKNLYTEFIKNSIVGSLSSMVSVSPSELDNAIVNVAMPDFNVEAWIFTAKTNDIRDYKQLQNLKRQLHNCDELDPKLYSNFADAEKIDRKLNELPGSTKSIIYDTKASNASSVYKEGDKFKLIFVCKKEAIISSDDVRKMKIFLSNKKMSQKAIKFFRDLKAKADIKIMIP